jgi:hypothetical protein
VDAELETYADEIRSLLDRVAATLDGLTESQANRRPELPGANSVYVIVSHVLGNARSMILGIVCDRIQSRDRPAEFSASGGIAGLQAAARALTDEIVAAIADIPLSELDRRLVPTQELWGEGPLREMSVRGVLVATIEHASIHLGQLQVTRDMALKGAGS